MINIAPVVYEWVAPMPAEECAVHKSLDEIVKRAKETQSDALLITMNGRTIVDLYPDSEAIECQSITKSMTSLAIGMLWDAGKISSLDQPICEWYPQWRDGPKKDITIRHVLSHTSGLEALSSSEKIYQSEDCIEFALDADRELDPGVRFAYDNRDVNLLSGIVEKASGKRLDLFVKDHLFDPLGIKPAFWSLDRSGHAHAQGGLKISAYDLEKIGRLILQNGSWEGKQIISQKWIREMLTQGELNPECGLLWWVPYGPNTLYAGQGYLGQYLVIIPEKQLVAVRLVRYKENLNVTFYDFQELLLRLN